MFQCFPDDLLAPLVKAFLDPEEYLELIGRKDLTEGRSTPWCSITSRGRPWCRSRGRSLRSHKPKIESSAPYQPFHRITSGAVWVWPSDPGQSRNCGFVRMQLMLSKLLETTRNRE